MRSILTSLLIIFHFTSCNNPPEEKVERKRQEELLPEPDRHDRLLYEANQRLKKMDCVISDPDTSISGIMLRNSESADKFVGSDNKTDEKDRYYFYSKSDRETLTLTQHPGDGKNEISIISVTYSNKSDQRFKQLNIDTFKTEKGIKLGLSKEEVIAKLGGCYAVVDSTKECIELNYRIEDPRDSKTKILESNNMPVYFATYIFCKNKLRFFEYGFEYP